MPSRYLCSGTVRYNLAIVYSETERRAAAVDELRAILARKPSEQAARDFLLDLTTDAAGTNNSVRLPGTDR
jgi:hypothetical protein